MKTLYLHIGTPKTATSSIQIMLSKSRKLLQQHNYCFPVLPFSYPDVRSERNGHFLLFQDSEIRKNPSAEAASLRDERLAAGLDLIHESFQKCDNVILSEENLWYTSYDTKNYLQFLPEDAAEYGYTVKIIVYLRRQDQFIDSAWNQRVKSGKTGKTMKDFAQTIVEIRSLYLSYDQALDRLADKFGAENLIVRRFEENSWVNHSVLSDFLDALGLDPAIPYIPPENMANPRLTDNAAEIQRLINTSSVLSFDEKKHLSVYTKKLSDKHQNDPRCSQFTPKEAADFIAYFKKGNQKVVQNYIKDGKPLFFDKIEKLPVWDPQNPKLEKNISELLQLLEADDESEKYQRELLLVTIIELYGQVNNLKKFREKVKHPFRALRTKYFTSKAGN